MTWLQFITLCIAVQRACSCPLAACLTALLYSPICDASCKQFSLSRADSLIILQTYGNIALKLQSLVCNCKQVSYLLFMCSHTVWHQHFTLQATFTYSTIAAYEVRLVTCSQHCLLNANSLTALLGRPGLTSWFDGHLREAKFEFLADETQQRFNMLIIKWETLSRLIIPQMLFQVIHLFDLQEYRYNANSAI